MNAHVSQTLCLSDESLGTWRQKDLGLGLIERERASLCWALKEGFKGTWETAVAWGEGEGQCQWLPL